LTFHAWTTNDNELLEHEYWQTSIITVTREEENEENEIGEEEENEEGRISEIGNVPFYFFNVKRPSKIDLCS
jgi:hypothetical protein